VAAGDKPERIMGLRVGMWRMLTRAVESGRIIPYLAGITLGVALVMALVLRVFDRQDFPTYGTAVWFSVVSITTVGYGDVVPTTVLGRVFAGVLTVFGVTFIAFITAVVTSALITSQEGQLERSLEQPLDVSEPAQAEALARIEERLEAIERSLSP
jgi:voltage-gated potassium channel